MDNLSALQTLVAKVEETSDSKGTPCTSPEATMNAEDKLKEMTDRGWHVKVSRQKDSTWDLVGAVDGLAFSDRQTYCTYGRHKDLLAALLDLEQMLLEDSTL